MKYEYKLQYPVWHPFTQMKTAGHPVKIVRGEGAYLFTEDGNAVLDAISSWWVNLHGHAHPEIAAAIAAQAKMLEQVIFAGFTHEPAIRLAEELLQLMPAVFGKVFFTDDGSTAVEVALKIALQYHSLSGGKPRFKIIALENAYHGDTFGAMAVSERSAFNRMFEDKLFEVLRIPAPEAGQEALALDQLAQLLSAGDVAAFIYEPLVQGSGGMRMHSPSGLDPLIALARQQNVICIADEVMTGFGRTGSLLASSQMQHMPDIICLSKGITGGFMPLGATLVTQEIFDRFWQDDRTKALFHGHSYTANPLACAAALASLKITKSKACEDQRNRIARAHEMFVQANLSRKGMQNLRACGTLLAFDLGTTEAASYFHGLRDRIYAHALSNGVLLRPLGNVVYAMPPYCIMDEDLTKLYDVLLSCTDLIHAS